MSIGLYGVYYIIVPATLELFEISTCKNLLIMSRFSLWHLVTYNIIGHGAAFSGNPEIHAQTPKKLESMELPEKKELLEALAALKS